jgi:hypothetical protein
LLRYIEASPESNEEVGAAAHRPSASGDDGDGEPRSGRRVPVRVSVAPERVELGATPANVAVTIRIHAEYHLTAHEPGVQGLVPTELRLENAPAWTLDVRYPAGKQRRYAYADQALAVYEDSVVLHAAIRPAMAAQANPPTTGGPPRLVLRYQICTDSTCLEPREDDLPVEIIVLP